LKWNSTWDGFAWRENSKAYYHDGHVDEDISRKREKDNNIFMTTQRNHQKA